MIVGEEKVHETVEKALKKLDEEDELVEVDEVFLIVAVHYGTPDPEKGAETGSLFYRCTSARIHVQYGLLEYARRAIDETIEKENA